MNTVIIADLLLAVGSIIGLVTKLYALKDLQLFGVEKAAVSMF